MSFVLELQNLDANAAGDLSPSTWSNWLCQSTSSWVLCVVDADA
ncbi:SapB/AmfS family lanthipeptide [Amycolatopsis lurida]